MISQDELDDRLDNVDDPYIQGVITGLRSALAAEKEETAELNEFVKAHGLTGALQTWRVRGSEGTDA